MTEAVTLALDKAEATVFQTLDGLTHPCLILYSGPDSGRRFDLEIGRLVIGRGNDADVPVDGAGISRRHAELVVTTRGVELRDLGSANCTYVNQQRVQEPVLLKDGDLVGLANLVLRFHDRRSLDAVLHDRLYRLATVDPGTSVFNRRYTQAALQLDVQRARKSGSPLTVFCCDLDQFKSVNDRFGHAGGDEVLKTCAALLRGELRAGDVIGRWGGEEFLIIARGMAAEHAPMLAERLRVAVEVYPFTLALPGSAASDGTAHSEDLVQTVSIGVATLDERMKDEHDLIDLADQRLYAAKRAGRNRVVGSDVG